VADHQGGKHKSRIASDLFPNPGEQQKGNIALLAVSSTDQRNTYLRPRTWSDGDVSSGWIYGRAERGALGALEEG
jgi:hypothetical protein